MIWQWTVSDNRESCHCQCDSHWACMCCFCAHNSTVGQERALVPIILVWYLIYVLWNLFVHAAWLWRFICYRILLLWSLEVDVTSPMVAFWVQGTTRMYLMSEAVLDSISKTQIAGTSILVRQNRRHCLYLDFYFAWLLQDCLLETSAWSNFSW